MKNVVLFLLCMLCFCMSAQAPDWGWLKSAAGTGDEQFSHLATDAQGNVYAGGMFNAASVVISNSVLINSGTSGRDVMIAKYNKVGALLWLYKLGGTGDEILRGLATDPSGNLVVTGHFDSPFLSSGNSVLTNASGSTDVFLLKLNPSGSPIWSAAYGGNLLEEAAGVCCDNLGNILVAGTFRSLGLSFGNVGVINSGGADGFLVKFSSGGVAQWARQIGGSGDELMQAVTTDSTTNVYVGGDFNSTVLSTYGFTCQGQFDLFIGRYDLSTGNFAGARQIGGTQSDNLQALQVNTTNEIFIAGSFASPILNLGAITLNLGSTRDLLIIKTTATLQTIWAKRYSGNSGTAFSSLQVDGSGVIASGSFNTNALVLGPLTFTNAATFYKGFVAQFNSSGGEVWGLQTSGTADEKLLAACPDNAGSFFVSGYYSAMLRVGTQSLSSVGLQDALLGRLCLLPATPILAGPSVLCRRSAVTFSASAVSGIVFNWYSSATASNALLSGSNQFSANTPGTYYAGAQSTLTGCYSALRSAISVTQPARPLVSVSGKTVMSSPAASYQWLRCDRDSVISTANSATYALPFSGYFSVATLINSCKDTSACVFYSVNVSTGTITLPGDTIKVATQVQEQLDAKVDWRLSPNPTQGLLYMTCKEPLDFVIVSMQGQVVMNFHCERGPSVKDLSTLPSGLYVLRDDKGKAVRRIALKP